MRESIIPFACGQPPLCGYYASFSDLRTIPPFSGVVSGRAVSLSSFGSIHPGSLSAQSSILAATKPLGTSRLPLEWWIGRGKPINPYLRGQIREMLRRELKAKEQSLLPSDL
ncbi:putative mitochondrial protein [Cucumis melo var. makuwa]|uniref:Mitochondrial protein n=1 Tax=Cucumis melo var. makuwa TaxID=1194695 RepID=A0A5D3CC17_CUCMM|nr:putative mitochondrial protein [Cucumis melo var. makuwa]TYK08774.1 putative mitochondrial protein [Cucumis melo var. makuwa]